MNPHRQSTSCWRPAAWPCYRRRMPPRPIPEIFRNEKAAKYALAQAGVTAAGPELGPNSLIGVSIRRNGPSSCRYQLAGRGRHIAAALVDPAAVPDPRSWLEARLGPLAGFWPDPSRWLRRASTKCRT